MYTRLNVVKDAENRAEIIAYKDRLRYEKFIIAGEQFAAENGLIISGPIATQLLLGNTGDQSLPPEVKLDSFNHYNFFSTRANEHARALGNILYNLDPLGLGHYTTVLTKITNQVLTITVDGRTMFTITSLPSHGGIRFSEIIIPSLRPSQFAGVTVLCTGPEIQLIDTYATLCNPSKVNDWESLLTIEASLRALFSKEIRIKINTSVVRKGGSASKKMLLYYILRDRYAMGPSRVLIGPVAISLITKHKSHTDRLQVITAGTLDNDAQEIVSLAKTIGVDISWKIDNPKILTDSRIRRLTIHHNISGHRESILDVYNSASFELVPFITVGSLTIDRHPTDKGPSSTLKLGTPFVLMRYRLIDLWTLQVLMHMNVINAGYAKSAIHEIISGYDSIAKYYETVLAGAARNPEKTSNQLLPLISYIGRLEDTELATKRETQSKFHEKSHNFNIPYYPAAAAK